MPRDALIATVAGLTAVVAGLGAALLDLPSLAVGASLGAGGAVVGLLVVDRRAGERQREVDVLRVRLEDSEHSLREARAAFEEAHEALGEAERLTAEAMEMDSEVPDNLLDPTTGLLGEQYFHAAIADRMAAARRHLRPVTIVLADVEMPDGNAMVDEQEHSAIADVLQRTLRESDTTCRMADGRYALILEDTADTSAVWAVERIRRAIQVEMPAIVRAGIAAYPTHGLNSSEVYAHADTALLQARELGHDGIQVARAD